ncbi:TIR domain [Branchiostoma belcheri]|nr:TIR domain [Branchiostoma belcheri]
MAGVLPIILSICAISRGIAMGARETGSTGGESLPLVAQQTCNCSQSTLISFECLCLDLSSLAHGQDRTFLSKHLSDTPEIIDFVVKCKRKSSTNTSGLFNFLPTSVKKLKLAGCLQQHVGKKVFYGISEVEEVAIENFPPDQLELGGNYLDVINKSFPPVELDPELFLSTPQLQKLTLAFLSLDRFPKALYQDVNGDISLQMTHNPLTCDCGLYELMSNLDAAKQGVLYTKTDFQHMECTFPDMMAGRRVEEISPSGLWCSHECYNRPYYCICFERAGELIRSPGPECNELERKACPSECSCSFQGQLHSSTSPYNELVNCSWRNLTSVPDDISNATTILHLEGNQLTVINRTVLPKLSMTRELYLNDNNITHVGDMSFNNFISLEILRLDGNNIPEINSAAFKSLSRLRELYLNNSGVRYLAADTFQNLANLRELQLENNKLKSIPENMFSGLKKLTLLGIHGNPLTCGCDVLWFANWLRSRVYLLSQRRNVSCVASTKVSQEILSLSVAEFDCEDLQAAQARTRLITGLSILLVLVTILFVCVIVVVKQKEAIQVYLYARYGWRFREEEEDDEDKEYDAFLSYSQHDLDVVLQDVLPALENREPPFRVCLHHRDFLPGIPIAENILNAVSASKRTIILLSNNFLESDWCQLEFQAAHAQMLQDRANRVIVILLDDIPAENAPADIQHYLKTNTYLKWGDERFWERLIYAMPRPRPYAQNEDGDRLALVELDHNAFLMDPTRHL